MPLAAVPDDSDSLAVQQGQVRVLVVVHCRHDFLHLPVALSLYPHYPRLLTAPRLATVAGRRQQPAHHGHPARAGDLLQTEGAQHLDQ